MIGPTLQSWIAKLRRRRCTEGATALSVLLVLFFWTQVTDSLLRSKESDADEQWLLQEDYAVEERFSRVSNPIEQEFPHEDAAIEPGFPCAPIVVEQGLPQGQVKDDQELANTRDVDEKEYSRENVMDEQEFPLSPTVVEPRFSHGRSVSSSDSHTGYMAAEQELLHQG